MALFKAELTFECSNAGDSSKDTTEILFCLDTNMNFKLLTYRADQNSL